MILTRDSNLLLQGKVVHFDLDGAHSDLTMEIIMNVTKETVFAYAFDSNTDTFSPNTDSMKQGQEEFGSSGKTQLFQVDSSQSGCAAGAQWCVHSSLINRVPLNPLGSSPSDYTDFTPPHGVTTQYFATPD